MPLDCMREWCRVVAFIKHYRRKGAFKDFSDEEILKALYDASQVDGLAILVYENRVTAVGLGRPNHQLKHLHVHTILTTQSSDLINFVGIYLERFPGYAITAFRKGKLRYYNTERLIKHLWATKDKVQ